MSHDENESKSQQKHSICKQNKRYFWSWIQHLSQSPVCLTCAWLSAHKNDWLGNDGGPRTQNSLALRKHPHSEFLYKIVWFSNADNTKRSLQAVITLRTRRLPGSHNDFLVIWKSHHASNWGTWLEHTWHFIRDDLNFNVEVVQVEVVVDGCQRGGSARLLHGSVLIYKQNVDVSVFEQITEHRILHPLILRKSLNVFCPNQPVIFFIVTAFAWLILICTVKTLKGREGRWNVVEILWICCKLLNWVFGGSEGSPLLLIGFSTAQLPVTRTV